MLARLGLFAGLVLVWLIILLPLKAVMMMAGGASAFGYQDVYGSVWDGRVYGMRMAGVPIREIEMAADPLPLLAGRLAARWRVSDDSARGRGHVSIGGSTVQVSDMDLLVSIDRLGLRSFPGLDRSQMIDMDITALSLRDGRCEFVQGRVQTTALVQFASTYGFEGPALLGVLSCDDGRLVITLDGAGTDLELTGSVQMDQTTYTWDLELRTGRPELADALALAGMTRSGDIWRYQGSDTFVVQ